MACYPQHTKYVLFRLIFAFACLSLYPLYPYLITQASADTDTDAIHHQQIADLKYLHLYEKIFGHKPQLIDQELSVLLYIDQKPQGRIKTIVPGYGDGFMVDARQFLSLIKRFIRPNYQQQLFQLINERGLIPLLEMRQSGYDFVYDKFTMKLYITTPGMFRNIRELNLKPASIRPSNIEPSHVSGYLNIRATRPFGKDQEDTRLQTTFDGGMNIYRWFTYANLLPDQDNNRYVAQTLRLSRDFLKSDMRFSVGDLDYTVLGKQNLVRLTGIGLTKGQLLPDSVTNFSLTQYQLVLPEPSTVEFWINDKLVRTEKLEAGGYDVRNFPLQYGFNDVEIRVLGFSGKRKTYNFPFIQDQRLVPQGKHEFSYNLGVPVSIDTTAAQRNHGTQLHYSAFHKFGLSNHWSSGPYAQGNHEQSLIGIENLYAIPSGMLRLDLSASSINKLDKASAWDISYQSYSTRNFDALFRQYGFGINNRDRHFGSLGQTSPDNIDSLSYYAFLQFALSEKLTGTIRYSKKTYRDAENQDEQRTHFFMTYKLSRRLALRSWIDTIKDRTGNTDYEARIGFTFNPERTTRIEARKNVHEDEEYYAFRATSGAGLSTDLTYDRKQHNKSLQGNLRYNLAAQRDLNATIRHTENADADAESDFLALNYRGNRATMGGTFTAETGKENGELRFATALAFADGHFGISRPIQSNFVIIHPNQLLQGHHISFDPDGQIDSLGNAVISDLTKFQPSQIQVSKADIPIGVSLGKGVYNLYPYDNTGYTIGLGDNSGIVLRAQLTQLTNGNKKPVINALGVIIPVDRPVDFDNRFFTDAKGRFIISGLKPGSYKLRLKNHSKNRSVYISIPEKPEQKGLHDAGLLTIR